MQFGASNVCGGTEDYCHLKFRVKYIQCDKNEILAYYLQAVCAYMRVCVCGRNGEVVVIGKQCIFI